MWSDFESDVVEGRYPLAELVRSEGRCGWFETKYEGKPAVISLTESLNDEDVLLERLKAAQKVKDKNVAEIFEVGATEARETPLVYAVMEHTEENLDDVLRARALSADETKEVAESLVSALRAIHKERLVCVRSDDGQIEAASVLAAGDTVKLRSDHLLHVAPDAAFAGYVTRDVRGLGSLIYQCLTQRAPATRANANDPSLQRLPASFIQIVRRAWSGMATLDEIEALLRPAAVPATTTPVTKTEAPAAANVAAAKPVVKPSAPIAEAEPPTEKPTISRHTALIVGGFVVLLVIMGLVLRGISHSSGSTGASSPKVVVAQPDAPAAASPAKAAPSSTAKPLPRAVKAVAPPVVQPASSRTGNWRVVAYTYNHQDQADHKARTINEKHPDLQASVFSPKGNGAPYLVTLGSPMEREDAFRLRDKARSEGLPRDTFAQNYSR